MGIGEPGSRQPGRSAAPRPQHNAPAGTGTTWRGLARGPAWPSLLAPSALVRPPALTVAELQQRGRVVQAAIAGEAVLHAEAGPRPLRPRSPTHCALPSRRGAGAGAGPAVAAAGHHGNPGPPLPRTNTRRPSCPRGGGLGGVARRRRGGWGAELGAPGSRLGPHPWSPPWSLPLGSPDRMLRGGTGTKGEKGRDACSSSQNPGEPLAHPLSPMRYPCALGSCCTKHGPRWRLPLAERLLQGRFQPGASHPGLHVIQLRACNSGEPLHPRGNKDAERRYSARLPL